MEKNAMQRLNDLILQKNSRICAGLDPRWEDIPYSVKGKLGLKNTPESGKVAFDIYCMEYIDAISDIVPAIKMDIAFFERLGHYGLENGLEIFCFIAEYAKSKGLFVIADINRSGSADTSATYAETYLRKNSPFDAITINPYFGTDGVMPFLKEAKENGKGVFVLVKTFNKSSAEIQDLELKDGRKVYEAVADKVIDWVKEVDKETYDMKNRIGYPMIGSVVGATHPEQAENLSFRMGRIFTLVPGYGEQGATAEDVAVNFDYEGTGAIVNYSRGIINAYKSERWNKVYSGETWAEAAKTEAIRATEEINEAINWKFGGKVCSKKG